MSSQIGPATAAGMVSVRPMGEADLDRADEIFRVAFGTFLGVAEPKTFFGTTDYVRTRWTAEPRAAFAAVVDGEVVGSNFDWGSVGLFGPLTVHPDLWDRGIGNSLLEPVMDCFEMWGNQHLGLFTFSHSHCGPGSEVGRRCLPDQIRRRTPRPRRRRAVRAPA
jgi:hypothetical protein